jgi:hypothetical protein
MATSGRRTSCIRLTIAPVKSFHDRSTVALDGTMAASSVGSAPASLFDETLSRRSRLLPKSDRREPLKRQHPELGGV